MKRFLNITGLVFLLVLVNAVTADTFKNKETGKTFTGFVTQKSTGGKTLVYNSEESKMTPVVLSDYEVTTDRNGRRDTVTLLQLTEPQIMLSDSISKLAAEALTDASNKGPQAIIIEIDSPGGRGDYMKNIAQAVSQTKNCPVYAYISGKVYGGAFSSAALVALACDKIYINPIASIGAVGPPVEGLGDQGYGNFLNTFTPPSLVTFSGAAATFAQDNGRPVTLAKAMVDKGLSVVEVANLDGSKEYVRLEDRQSTQTLIRTLSEGMKQESLADLSNVTEIDVVGKVVNLTSQQAIDSGLVDMMAGSIDDILADQEMQSMKLTPIPGIDNQVKRYLAAKRNIAEGLLRIEQQEEWVETLNNQFTQIDTQLRQGMNTREVAQGNPYAMYRSGRTRYQNPTNFDNYYQGSTGISRNSTNRASSFLNQPSERVVVTEPSANFQVVYQQLGQSLQQLVAEYRRTVNLARRWPGALPVGMSVTSLQQYMDSAEFELEKLRRYQPPYIAPIQMQQQQQTRRGRERIQNPNQY